MTIEAEIIAKMMAKTAMLRYIDFVFAFLCSSSNDVYVVRVYCFETVNIDVINEVRNLCCGGKVVAY